jgi:GNAT superfamily N-acetyltransferase
MFRFDLDYGRSVLYTYEMQVEEKFQKKGLGSFMMESLEKMAISFTMERMVLTLLTNNPDAQRFYERLGYKVDETDEGNEGYRIYSKILL